MARIKFTTDSASDIPAALREELKIQVLPFPIAMEDREYDDGFDFTPEEFYDMLLSAAKIPPVPTRFRPGESFIRTIRRRGTPSVSTLSTR